MDEGLPSHEPTGIPMAWYKEQKLEGQLHLCVLGSVDFQARVSLCMPSKIQILMAYAPQILLSALHGIVERSRIVFARVPHARPDYLTVDIGALSRRCCRRTANG
ncbi:hypothetical protein M404DRAFT_1006640 [Pisolithus tinctorius Marx 270]|uniref:Uncharacterized protein n=1 Tax=Pisolithus tinctorius Marx 270 TaxID=870435 RepID=A0A0C3NMQ5_PISTI|nr:hypothetical protein M404DRAFT_1006640 [Pisolithus tinctorius Marx 270]